MKTVILTILLVLLMVFPAAADECGCSFETGAEFGAHVSTMAQDGHIGSEHNPGHHQGYSPFVP